MLPDRVSYCYLLGLNPYKEKNYSLDSILAKLEKKRKDWENESKSKNNDHEKRFKAQRLVEMVDDIRKVMSDDRDRHAEFENGTKYLKKKCSKLLGDCIVLEDGTRIAIPSYVNNFVKNLKWEGVSDDDVKKALGLESGQPPSPVSKKVSLAFNGLLKVACYTPQEVLNVLINNPLLGIDCSPLSDGSSQSQVLKAFQTCYARVDNINVGVFADQDAYITALRSLDTVIKSKEDFDELVRYGKCQKALEEVKETLKTESYSSQLGRRYIDELLVTYCHGGIDTEMAIGILQEFCFKSRIPVDFSRSESLLSRCPECGAMVSVTPDVRFCPSCGKSFKQDCPRCGTSQYSTNAKCIKCGFDFQDGVNRIGKYERDFNDCYERGEIAGAKRNLDGLRELYPESKSIRLMERKYDELVSTVGDIKEQFNASYLNKRYHRSMELCNALMEQYRGVLDTDPSLKVRYNECVEHSNAAKRYCERARIASSGEERMELYLSALDQCPDYPEAVARMNEHPPQPPMDAQGMFVKDNVFKISFEPPSETKGVTFCLYRSRNGNVALNEDSRPIEVTQQRFFEDRNLDPGVEYYYAIYSRRWNVLSREAAILGPVMITAEVEDISVTPIDGGFRLLFRKPLGAARVRIWRSEESNKGQSIELHVDSDVYDDIGLKGGKEYHYLFLAEYDIRGRPVRSHGREFVAKSVVPPKPVNNLQIKWDEKDGSFLASWGSHRGVDLYFTDEDKPLPGSTMLMDDVRSWMKKKLVPVETYEDGMRFRLDDGTVNHIFPVKDCGKVGIVGNGVTVSTLKPFRDVEMSMSGKDCIISMNWPWEPYCVSAKLVVSDDSYAMPGEPAGVTYTISKDEYATDRMIRVPMGRSSRKYLNLFAVYRISDMEWESRGIAFCAYSDECRKVRYDVEKSRSGISITVRTDADVDRLPPVMTVETEVGIPLKSGDGKIGWTSDGSLKLDAGRAKIDLPAGAVGSVEHMRLFFQDDEDYHAYRFVHPLYRRKG
ncbi:MAG: zinc ribbon domain-containing protein [Candidatus Methanomethylophilaceae archaeon]|nr:zinc ribbon domain-containing protein [Candidatus Methanomethylophilaceae archaeon]